MANNYLDKTGVIRLIDNVKNMFASASHTHKKSDIDDLIIDSEFSSTSTNPVQNKVVSTGFGYVSNAITSLNSDVANKSDKGHDHAISDVTGLQSIVDAAQQSLDVLAGAVNGKADSVHSHAIEDVTDLQSALDSKANVNNVAYIDENDKDTVIISGDIEEIAFLIGGDA